MPNNQDTLVDKLEDIGDAIRAKTGKSDKLTLSQMPTEIGSISGGGEMCNLIPLMETKVFPEWIEDREYYDSHYSFLNEHNTYETAIEIEVVDPGYKGAQTLPNFKASNIYYESRICPKTPASFFHYKVHYKADDIVCWTTPIMQSQFHNTTSCVLYPIENKDWEFPNVVYSVNNILQNAIGNANHLIPLISFPRLKRADRLLFNQQCYIDKVYLPALKEQYTGNPVFGNNCYVNYVYLRDITSIGGSNSVNGFFRNNVTGNLSLIIDNTQPPQLNSYLYGYAHNNASNPYYNGSAKIYVPRAGLSAYENATNWSVYYAAGNILAIEDSETDLKGIFPQLDEKMGW